MCTAVKFISNGFYFGRTLDNDTGYAEEIVVTPRRRKLCFRQAETLVAHHAIIGMATVVDNLPLYYDGCNDVGLAMAGLNLVGPTEYCEPVGDKTNIASFEFIPWVLGQCRTVAEAKKLIACTNMTKEQVNPDLPNGMLHWMIADRDQAIVVESDASGLHVYDNPVGVMTNNPPFPTQLFSLNNYMALSPRPPENSFSDKLTLDRYSRGMGAFGLPGDLSSQSRFIRAAFTALNSTCCNDCISSVNQFFHIMDTVAQTRGCCVMDNGEYETTIYTACCDVDNGVYYYNSYGNRRLSAVDMKKTNVDGVALIRYPMIKSAADQVYYQN